MQQKNNWITPNVPNMIFFIFLPANHSVLYISLILPKYSEKVGSKNKLKRFKENETFNNVFQPTREEVVGDLFPLKGNGTRNFSKMKIRWCWN